MSESVIKNGDRITVEGIAGEHIAQVHVGQLPPAYRKRGGRKPCSKNRPKADQGKEVAKLKARIAELEARPPPASVSGAAAVIALLERGALIRVSAMDSDSRLTGKIRELQAIAAEAVQMLRGAQ